MDGAIKALRVEIRGGDESSRQLLGTSITALLQKEGFKSVSGFMENGVQEINTKRMMQKTVADIVEQSRPDLFNAVIKVVPKAPPIYGPNARFKLVAEGPNDFSVQDTRGDVRAFLEMAEDYKAEHNITVISSSAQKVGEVVAELLDLNETIVVKGQLLGEIGKANLLITQF